MGTIRRYVNEDCNETIQLFYETVHSVNAKDYTKAQLDAWASEEIDAEVWDESLSRCYTVVCEINGVITGFGNIDDKGYLDRIFVHKDEQRKGIASAIVHELENYATYCGIARITTNASITAKPFFEKQGYRVLVEQQVERKNQKLTNYTMEKWLINNICY